MHHTCDKGMDATKKIYSKAEMSEQNLCFHSMTFTKSATAETWDRNYLGLSHATVTVEQLCQEISRVINVLRLLEKPVEPIPVDTSQANRGPVTFAQMYSV